MVMSLTPIRTIRIVIIFCTFAPVFVLRKYDDVITWLKALSVDLIYWLVHVIAVSLLCCILGPVWGIRQESTQPFAERLRMLKRCYGSTDWRRHRITISYSDEALHDMLGVEKTYQAASAKRVDDDQSACSISTDVEKYPSAQDRIADHEQPRTLSRLRFPLSL